MPDTVRHWHASPRAAARFLTHAATLDLDRLEGRRALTMPGISVTVAEQVEALQQEVERMKEALMYGGDYRQASAGERLSAVKKTTGFATENNRLDRQITDILVFTMNNDKSVNVRMAAAEALFRFRDEVQIRKALVGALSQQEDPQMQLTLIDMIVHLKAKGALNEMNKLLVDSETREIVRERLRTGIAELKA